MDEAIEIARDSGRATPADSMKNHGLSRVSVRERCQVADLAWVDVALTSGRPGRRPLLRYFRNLDTAEEAFQRPASVR